MNSALHLPEDPRNDDAEADRRAFLIIAIFIFAAFLVSVLSSATEIERSGSDFPIGRVIIYEATGFGGFLAFFPVIARLVTFATPGEQPWRRVIAFHALASFVLIALQIFVFVAARKALIPLFFGEPYTFSDDLLRDFIYEYRKSLLGYATLVMVIAFGRQLAQQQRELAAAREDAKTSKKLTLKCGGRAIHVDAREVRWAKSASNYVEVAANGKTHLARATLAAIERQLADAGASAVRVHRSYVVNTDYISEIRPTGEGDVRIEMRGGEVIPGSRRYRDRLPGSASSTAPS